MSHVSILNLVVQISKLASPALGLSPAQHSALSSGLITDLSDLDAHVVDALQAQLTGSRAVEHAVGHAKRTIALRPRDFNDGSLVLPDQGLAREASDTSLVLPDQGLAREASTGNPYKLGSIGLPSASLDVVILTSLRSETSYTTSGEALGRFAPQCSPDQLQLALAQEGSKQASPAAVAAGKVGVMTEPDGFAEHGSAGPDGFVEHGSAGPDRSAEHGSAGTNARGVSLTRVIAPPGRDDAMYVGVQIWHHDEHVLKRKPEWTARLESERYSRPNKPPTVHYVNFYRSARKAREAAARFVKVGKLSAEWVEAWSRELEALTSDTLVGLITLREFGRGAVRADGQSSNSKLVFQGYWAAMALNADGTAPVELQLYLGSTQPIATSRIVKGAGSKPKSADFFCACDPNGFFQAAQANRELRAHLAEDKRLTEYSPTTQFAKYVRSIWNPIVDSVNHLTDENVALHKRCDDALAMIEMLAREIDDLKARAAARVTATEG